MPAWRRAAVALREALLWLAALGGLVCIALAVLGHALGFGVVLFQTGSMSPAIPAGSAALVRTVPAASVRVGDVVTVDRPGTAPVTHRVVSVEVAGDAGGTGARVLALRGDANEAPDPTSYRVDQVRRVVWSVPRVAPALARFASPAVAGPTVVGASALVVWALWPRPTRVAGPLDGRVAGGRAGGRAPRARSPRRRTAARTAARTGGVLLVATALVPAGASPSWAGAPPSPGGTLVEGRHVSLLSVGDLADMATLSPGEPVDWVIGVMPHGAQVAVARSLHASGWSADLVVEVDGCPTRWTGEACPGSTRLLAATGLPPGGATVDLGAAAGPEPVWLRVRVGLRDGARQGPATGAGLTIVATASGEVVAVHGPDAGTATGTGRGRLASTGGQVIELLAVAAVLVVGGLLLTRRPTTVGRDLPAG